MSSTTEWTNRLGRRTLSQLLAPGIRRTALGLGAAAVALLLSTVVARAQRGAGTAVPALLYLVGVTIGSIVGGLWAGLAAAAAAFVLLDFFFTEPKHTLIVAHADDVFGLIVFLAVAVFVSAAATALLEQRTRAERGEREVRTLARITTRLLSGELLPVVLQDVATSLRSLYGLSGCAILVVSPDGENLEEVASGQPEPPMVSLPLTVEGRMVGRIDMSGPSVPGSDARMPQALETFSGQLALAMERDRRGREVEEARTEAEASRIRAALFSSVTHDLRTPLASITASASSLLEEGVPFSESQRLELLRTILEESQRLNRLVGNLMDLSRVRAGALLPSIQPVPIEDVVSAVVERMRPALGGRPLAVRIRDDIPPVPVDVMQMDQVLTNILENAVRYSPNGAAISISASRWEDAVEVRVSDRGPGIPVHNRDHVFEEFYRRDVNGARAGTGLGLAIARAVIAAHGGAIWIEETPGGGATVGFRLPLGRAAATP
jgi:two-component system sensor histidine kinase KdpD